MLCSGEHHTVAVEETIASANATTAAVEPCGTVRCPALNNNVDRESLRCTNGSNCRYSFKNKLS